MLSRQTSYTSRLLSCKNNQTQSPRRNTTVNERQKTITRLSNHVAGNKNLPANMRNESLWLFYNGAQENFMNDTLLLGFPEYAAPARSLANWLKLPYATIELHRFPDGESKVKLPASLPASLILCRSLNQPNDKLIELLLSAETARAAGVRQLILVAPYLCYMRQDIAFSPGEAVSQGIIAAWLARLFDGVITVDPHLHRINSLTEVMPNTHAVSLSADKLIAALLQSRTRHPLLVGPDSESRQWVARIAAHAGCDFIIAEKQRLSDHEVRITLPPGELRGRTAVIIDDIASTGRTLAATATLLREAGAAAVHCCITHALFAENAEQELQQASVQEIWSSDSIPHASNAFSLAPLLAEAIEG